MGVKQLANVISKVFNDEIGTIPDGFTDCSLKNSGTATATITQGGNSWELEAGEVFSFGTRKDNDAWMQVEVDARGTIVKCVYFN